MPRGSRLLGYGCALLSSALMATLLVVTGIAHQPPDRGETLRSRPAAMGSSYLCTGYAGCRDAGYSDAGYGSRSGRMYWRMYSGHNCTNYAAYRMIKAGMSEERPWSGSGMAYNWGHAMADITDRRPAVGAIAWWDRYEGGIGSSGHVAYVEKVVSADEIVISEDSWSGDFHWRRITRDSGRWPSGFIHFVDKAMTNEVAPTIFGTPQVGAQLRASTGNWKPSAETFQYQWLADGVEIAGATQQTFTPTAAQRGTNIRVSVTARKPDFDPTTALSAPTARVTAGEFAVEQPTTIEGQPMVDETLRAVPATWSPAPQTTVYRWLVDGEILEGADGPTLTLTKAMVGKSIQATTAARREGYKNAPVRSAPAGPVVVGAIELDQEYAVSGSPQVGEQLILTPGSYRPTDAAPAYQWLRDGVPIAGATGTTYEVTGADLGARLRAQVTLTRRNYATRTVRLGPEGIVTTRAAATVDAVGRRGRAVVRVRVTAPGLEAVDGRVTITVAKETRTVQLVAGRARVVLDDLAPGRRTVWVRYDGTPTVEAARATTSVRVLR
ncbi:surface antigen [Nocardioides thalensis]|uniref:Surface antigen n=1 Tax=Nocardioides thalensis TaxID=1914755 RepID=A0A853C1H1_9ACTN|nr:CHAP domain-containing protein [Nocardioides thalensis]NYJ00458.1 surface antigen [Nocardioides thalensis]